MMIAAAHNGHAGERNLAQRIRELDEAYFTQRRDREAAQTYAAGTSDRMNPIPRGIDPLGTDADYHYRTERNYFLMVERGRSAVRDHPLVEQAINRLIANMRIGDFTLDVDSGDEAVDADQKAFWHAWCDDPRLCDYEQRRTFQQIARQSFFSQCQDGDIVHIPLRDGSLETWESHHLRNPGGRRATGLATDGFVHGVEVQRGRTVAYWLTPRSLTPHQSLSRGQSRRFPAYDLEGNKIVFWMGFTHRFKQRRGISRLSPPRVAMRGFDDLNYAHIKSALRRALIAYLMENSENFAPNGMPTGGSGKLPQGGDRYTQYDVGLGLQQITVEQVGEPAQVLKAPEGYSLKGWNATMPTEGFFKHAALMLTMLAVNLDLPLSFLLLDGSLVNFHGGRMTFDQVKMRLEQLIADLIQGLYVPTYQWKTRQRVTPGSPFFDPALYAATQRGINPFNFRFRPKGWPYVKPLEDAAAEDLAERRNLKSMRSILAARGIDLDDFVPEVIRDRGKFIRAAVVEAVKIVGEFPEVFTMADVNMLWREIRYGNEATGAKLAISANTSDGGEAVATATMEGDEDDAKPADQPSDDRRPAR